MPALRNGHDTTAAAAATRSRSCTPSPPKLSPPQQRVTSLRSTGSFPENGLISPSLSTSSPPPSPTRRLPHRRPPRLEAWDAPEDAPDGGEGPQGSPEWTLRDWRVGSFHLLQGI